MKRWQVLALAFLLFVATPRSTFAQADQINIAAAQIVNSPDVRNWPITTALTQMSFDGSTTRVNFTKKDGPNRWPDVVPAGWQGPLEYTLWLFVSSNGQWVGSGFIQFWNGRDGSGNPGDPDVPSVFHKNWYYSQRWAPIFGHGQIQPGETVGFMVTSGNARDSVGPFGPAERSNVVLLQATDRGTFDFAATPTPVPPPAPIPVPVPIPAPVPVPQPVPQPPAPLPSNDLTGYLLTQQAVNQAAVLAELHKLETEIAATRQDIADFREAVKSKWAAIVNNPVFKYGLAALTGFLATHKWGG